MYKITLIVPVYNADKYLDDLMNSVIKQTIGFDNVQVIFVDDCSTDESIKIIDGYANEYSNVLAIKLEENHMYAGIARNEGLKLAEGKYIMFSDSDDFLMKDACEIFYNEIESKNADFITGNYINADEDGTVWDNPIFNLEKYKDFKLDIHDYDKTFFVSNGSACNKVFRKSFIDEHNIRFYEGTPAEDAFFTSLCLLESSNAYYTSKIIHGYRQRNKDTKVRSVSFSCDIKYFTRINKAYKAIFENYKSHDQIRFYRYVYAKNMSYLLYKFIDSNQLTDQERIVVLKDMSWFYELSVILKVPACQMAQSMIIGKILEDDYKEAINYCKLVSELRTFMPKEIRESMSRPDANMYSIISKYDKEY